VLDALYALWFDHLWDNIPTVREDSAAALAQAVRAYGQEALDKITPVLRWGGSVCGCVLWKLVVTHACSVSISTAADAVALASCD